MASIRLTEPHPSIPTPSTRLHSGRGGAGNVHPATFFSPTTPPAPPNRHDTRKAYMSGIGGAGNVHRASERAIFSFDEELQRLQHHDVPVHHIGRGGAGNWIDVRRHSFTSQSSAQSGKAKFSLEWAREKFSK